MAKRNALDPRVLGKSSCNLSVQTRPDSKSSVTFAPKASKILRKSARHLNGKVKLLASRKPAPFFSSRLPKAHFLLPKTNEVVSFPVFEEDRVFALGKGVKKRSVKITKDFDCPSDDELIEAAIKKQRLAVSKKLMKFTR